ncbi:O-antigen ligase family protein [Thalassoroseus pseudoceratinae]|uniref:O-antigen ligase family protein n=1 Tax=Thalassoroseus pseudoceratinae TaxID=2713176 RepID=UPI00142266F7|nr:O-antigen ligase family protein [Thalassoroseus pseudoceratinae]
MNGFWLVSLFVILAVAGWRMWKSGPRSAIGTAVAIAIILPVWISQSLGGQMIDLRIAGTACVLLMYLAHRDGTIRTKLVAIDFMVFGLVGVHCLADTYHNGFSAGILLRAYGEWLLPYFAGRLAIQSMDDIRDLLPIVVVVGCALSFLSILEAVGNSNPFETVFGNRPVKGIARDAQRFGMKRSFGPTGHPIYLAVLQLMLLPWMLYAFSVAKRKLGPELWLGAPFLCALGIFVTGSRAAIFATPIVLYIAALFIWKQWRKPLLIGGGICGVLLGLFIQPLLNEVQNWSRELEFGKTILVDGEEVQYTGTMNRFHLFKVYRPAMQRAGLLGFGTEAVSGFPINVPVGPQDVETLKRVRYIDNAYVLMLLRFGWLGLLGFIAVGVSVLVSQIRLALMTQRRGSQLFACLAGGTTAFLLTLMTVWMPHDFGFFYLWTAGATAGRLANLRPMARVVKRSSHHGVRRRRAA